ncbi:Protein translocase subunit SecF [hydrothermal vent metagenome]|uniref:Protein translocase subunit SecF n=1 Tax=hydrothermal vent metagenome TaxID=652676 RepID=A0A3B0ZN87_9ZZZZ
MRQLIQQVSFDFMAMRKPAIMVSLVLILISVISLGVRGLNLGIDFTGGTLIEVGYQQAADLNEVRGALADADFDDAIVQHFGSATDVIVRVAPREGLDTAKVSNQVLEVLQNQDESVSMRRVEFVGPQVGEELTEDGGLALLIALVCILVYVTVRFEKRFAAGSVLALIHDVIITLGIFSILQLEFDLSVLAAILAVVGYSLNDTIVVFDRIRENFRKIRKANSESVINTSLNQTLSRTLMTSLTTLLVLLSLFFFGGEAIHGFATALIIGVLVGTYSSIYVASTAVLMLGVSKADLMPIVKEGAELDDRP